jgi:hypothetical protein
MPPKCGLGRPAARFASHAGKGHAMHTPSRAIAPPRTAAVTLVAHLTGRATRTLPGRSLGSGRGARESPWDRLPSAVRCFPSLLPTPSTLLARACASPRRGRCLSASRESADRPDINPAAPEHTEAAETRALQEKVRALQQQLAEASAAAAPGAGAEKTALQEQVSHVATSQLAQHGIERQTEAPAPATYTPTARSSAGGEKFFHDRFSVSMHVLPICTRVRACVRAGGVQCTLDFTMHARCVHPTVCMHRCTTTRYAVRILGHVWTCKKRIQTIACIECRQ